jgi:DNA-binding MarR family transcriptional regulator
MSASKTAKPMPPPRLEGLGIHDINNVQGMTLFNIGDAEMTVGELTLRGCYLGSNVSYNVKNMVENGYLLQERSVHDRRSIHVKLTDKGRTLRDRLSGMHRRHIEMLGQTTLPIPTCRPSSRRCAGSNGSGSAPAIHLRSAVKLSCGLANLIGRANNSPRIRLSKDEETAAT